MGLSLQTGEKEGRRLLVLQWDLQGSSLRQSVRQWPLVMEILHLYLPSQMSSEEGSTTVLYK